ncbi:hypothetical protein LX99_04813 [Mucilaginibacter oryzae]|uniref:Uncharacterized protein n=1 Tax=Mucilaginibacter oryzae TaxID=468058 RepID=A0A316GVM6_9SPHI|nr:hypothetical protein [Mucilaginibacter oryzae]PWK68289.1 hypothetical protein LX99_04813 [Mucilaginibacter oryzae]
MILLFPLVPALCHAQKVYQSDWQHFWNLRDRLSATTETAKQRLLVNRLYIVVASEGLQAFMRNKDGLDRKWLGLLKSDPGFWDSLQRERTVIDSAGEQLEAQIGHFRELYPELKPGNRTSFG